MLRAGIVGLPNVGKSTLFNAVTRTRKAEAANYPFCTIDPNVGIVTVPDARLDAFRKSPRPTWSFRRRSSSWISRVSSKARAKGEGLGNKFLTHIREVDAIVQVVRCFEDRGHSPRRGQHRSSARYRSRQHRTGARRSGIRKKRRERVAKDAKRGDKTAAAEEAVLRRSRRRPMPASRRITVSLTPEESALSLPFFLLTDKPTIFACNVKEADLATADTNPYVLKVREYVRNASGLRGSRHQRADRKRPRRSEPAEAAAVSQGTWRAGKRRRRSDSRDVSFARSADLFHGG